MSAQPGRAVAVCLGHVATANLDRVVQRIAQRSLNYAVWVWIADEGEIMAGVHEPYDVTRAVGYYQAASRALVAEDLDVAIDAFAAALRSRR